MPNWSQISGALDRVIIVVLTWAVSKGYILPDDVPNYAALIMTIIGAAWAFWANRQINLAKRATRDIPNSTLIAPKAIADAAPSANVVSSADAKVTLK